MTRTWFPFGTAVPSHFVLHATEVHIWQVALEQDEARIAQLHVLLSPDEQQRAARFHFPADRRRYVVARGLLRLLLGQYLSSTPQALRFDYNAYGKPQLAAPLVESSLQFNLSHSGEVALYAFAQHSPLGIDIELARSNIEYTALAKQVFSPREQRTFAALPSAEHIAAFFRGWTRKEALIKAHGKGLSMPLDQFDVTLAPDEPAQLLATHYAPADVHNWSLCDVACPAGYAAALAIGAQPRSLVYGLCDFS